MRNYCTAVLIVLLLSACGLKAPLYLPQQQGETQQKPPQGQPQGQSQGQSQGQPQGQKK